MNFESVFQTPRDGFYFCGYYDKSPLSKDGKRLLVQRARFDDRMPVSGDILEIGYFDFPYGQSFIKIAETVAWNWQQGCMLQWLGPEHDNQVIFNDLRDGRFVSRIINLETEEESVIDHACYTISPDGGFGLAIDYERFYWYRPGYNYQGIENVARQLDLDPDDGIKRVDLRTGETTMLVSLADMMKRSALSSMSGAIHFLEHMMIDSAGKNVAFLHRWRLDDGGVYGRLCVLDLSTEKVRIVLDSGRVSHFCWRGSGELLCYGGMETSINRLRKNRMLVRAVVKPLMPIYARFFRGTSYARRKVRADGYLLLNTLNGDCARIGAEDLLEDGHPSFRPGQSRQFVSDTYPNKEHIQELFLWDIDAARKIPVDELESRADIDRTGMRCDLHPKWSYDGNFIAVDTVAGGTRAVRIYQVDGGQGEDK